VLQVCPQMGINFLGFFCPFWVGRSRGTGVVQIDFGIFFFQHTKSLSTKGRRILKSLDFIEKKSSLTGGEY
jgi:hypothetical protein